MQTWKLKKRSERRPKKTWAIRVLGVLMLAATAFAGWYDFLEAEQPFRLGLDLQGGAHLVYEADMSQIPQEDREDALEGVKDVIERRVNAFGVAEPVVQTTTTGGTYRIVIELAGISDVNEAIQQIGETPVLEFKEPGLQLDRELTAEEKQQLTQAQQADRAAASQALARARAGEDFVQLVNELSVEAERVEGGLHDGLVSKTEDFGTIVDALVASGTRPGAVHARVIENPEGLNVVKYEGPSMTQEMLLHHLLVCFEGKTACQNPISAIEANIKIRALKDQATAENFSTFAQENSTDRSGDGSGTLGWVLPGQMVPAFELAAKQTAVGAVSDVVETDFGYHLIFKEQERTTRTHSIRRVLMKLSTETDIVPPASPWVNTELSGKHLKRSQVQFDPNTGAPVVLLEFNTEGGELFGNLTKEHIGERVAIFLDGEVISDPVVQEAIYGGSAVIQGTYSVEEAKQLSQRLNAGALPVPVDLLSQQTVGPTLGSVSLQKSIVAALVGFALVGLFMILAYRLPGFLAVLALVLYALLNLAAYRLFGVTITLAGIAGFVLSLGMAVDANVLIIERLKEEYASGRDFATSVNEGFRRAWTAILDGNITTLIAGLILFYFSSSFIKGFALTLCIGVLLSMFTAIFVSRVYLKNIIDVGFFRKETLFGVKRK